MSDVVVDQTGAQPTPGPAPGQAPAEPHLGWALAGLSAGAGVIHIAMTPVHAAEAWQEALGFAASGWFQLVTAAVVLANRGGKRFYQLVAVANAAFIGAWVYSRTVGLPFGDNAGVAGNIEAIDATAVLLEVGVIVLALRLALAPEKRSVGKLAPALCAVAALGLATVAITSPDAATHDHGAVELTEMEKLTAAVDDTRCDTSFNNQAYWDEAEYLGIDTRWGGNPPVVDGAMAGGDHHGASASSSGATTTTTDPDPFEGRGSPGLDDLVSATGLAATSEIEAANLVTALSDASEEDYDAWLWWLRNSGSLLHEHSATATAEDGSGHGGHVGPQPWVAMTDQADCDQLQEELDLARETAMKYPTAQDAMDDGYRFVTPYLPGIASHWIKGSLIDGEFEIDAPEMLLYDGNDPDSKIVGLSYYIWHPGDNKPTQGFTGDNDHGHRHIGLCSSKTTGTVIGDSTTSEEDCAARGGSKSDGSRAWMSHAWVVPGCESPWGVFSAASPLLDDDLLVTSGTDDGGCAGAGVRDRYDMEDPASDSADSDTEVGTADTEAGTKDTTSDTATDTAGG